MKKRINKNPIKDPNRETEKNTVENLPHVYTCMYNL